MTLIIRDVWFFNLEEEIKHISENISDFPYVGLVTKYPATFLQPELDYYHTIKNPKDKLYAKIKSNVDGLTLIQLGLCLSDEQGNLPCFGQGNNHFVWQFNFCEFSPTSDLHDKEIIEKLEKSRIKFERNNEIGVEAAEFARLIMPSGILMESKVHWISFDGGYDFGYLIKLLSDTKLPRERPQFFNLMKAFFPVVYDVKHMMKFCDGLNIVGSGDDGDLNSVAETLGVEKPVGIAISYQSAIDSLLVNGIFKKLKENYFNGSIGEDLIHVLYDLGIDEEED